MNPVGCVELDQMALAQPAQARKYQRRCRAGRGEVAVLDGPVEAVTGTVFLDHLQQGKSATAAVVRVVTVWVEHGGHLQRIAAQAGVSNKTSFNGSGTGVGDFAVAVDAVQHG